MGKNAATFTDRFCTKDIVDRFYVLSRDRELGQFKKGQVTPEEIIEILVGDHNSDET